MQNQVIIQLFHWYLPADCQHWKFLAGEVDKLSRLGFTMVLLPPPYKSAKGREEPGYAVYDLYDLGEFDQKGTIPTKYGTKEEYLELLHLLQQAGILPIADLVLNHKLGGDEMQQVPVRAVDRNNRTHYLSDEQQVEMDCGFRFPGRNKTYSAFEWNWDCFSGFEKDGQVWKIQSDYSRDSWDWLLSTEKGNFNYLLGLDIEFRNPAVREELLRWLNWFIASTGHQGFRLDGLKHMNPGFTASVLQNLQEQTTENSIVIGEYLSHNKQELAAFLEQVNFACNLFDFPLHKNFMDAAKLGEHYDLRTMFNGSLVQEYPLNAITYVDNHDTQPLQEKNNYIPDWFRRLAYTLILLREGGIPVVFYCDIYGAEYGKDAARIQLRPLELLPQLLSLRKITRMGAKEIFLTVRKPLPGREKVV
ncbi:alpha-amylase [Flavihumibacter sp. CACIAM 22H1]|uniref:alpha-amylase n=1 Tax=Flavihumibacter sp. CACIAM 22H1 TaxID=1812911 RepID=UPI0007A8F99B|nr:alpha-amylase [Flavihumibacter sp. CACIAM 22H1]KYP13180.1 MAG: hypothetical protein A1D16_02025 [Flavihumibacter sp. CACIAM 22H1]